MSNIEQATAEALAREKEVFVTSKEATTVQVNGQTFDVPAGRSIGVPESVAGILFAGRYIEYSIDFSDPADDEPTDE